MLYRSCTRGTPVHPREGSRSDANKSRWVPASCLDVVCSGLAVPNACMRMTKVLKGPDAPAPPAQVAPGPIP